MASEAEVSALKLVFLGSDPIALPLLDWQTKKAAWFTKLSEAGVSLECNAPPLAQLPGWIAQRLSRQQPVHPADLPARLRHLLRRPLDMLRQILRIQLRQKLIAHKTPRQLRVVH